MMAFGSRQMGNGVFEIMVFLHSDCRRCRTLLTRSRAYRISEPWTLAMAVSCLRTGASENLAGAVVETDNGLFGMLSCVCMISVSK